MKGLGTTVAWWQRLLFAFGALVFTLLLTAAGFAIWDFWKEPGLHWFNGGEIQMTGAILYFGGLAALATYILLVVPVVLLWPVESQLKRWYAMLVIAMLWPPILIWSFSWDRPSVFLYDIPQYFPVFCWLGAFAVCACGCYLLLIRWQSGRVNGKMSDIDPDHFR